MTTLEERIKGALEDALDGWWDDDKAGYPPTDYLAEAVVAVLPTADVSVDDLAQHIRTVDGDHSLGAGALAEAIMPLLDAQAAAHAAEVETLRAENKRLDRALDDITSTADRAVREALENAAQQLDPDPPDCDHEDCEAERAIYRDAAGIVRSLVPGGTE